jgi:hypothetical protein
VGPLLQSTVNASIAIARAQRRNLKINSISPIN